ncbi:MAG: hypothetical protein ACYDCC_06445 [Actinomycetota bacterium]
MKRAAMMLCPVLLVALFGVAPTIAHADPIHYWVGEGCDPTGCATPYDDVRTVAIGNGETVIASYCALALAPTAICVSSVQGDETLQPVSGITSPIVFDSSGFVTPGSLVFEACNNSSRCPGTKSLSLWIVGSEGAHVESVSSVCLVATVDLSPICLSPITT